MTTKQTIDWLNRPANNKSKKITKFGRGYDYEEFSNSMTKIWNNYLLLSQSERELIVNTAKRF